MKTVRLLAAAAVVLALSACGRSSTYERTEVTEGYRVAFSDLEYAYVSIWTDPATGCDSYVTDDGFMSPRLNADGTQRCAARAPAALPIAPAG